MASTLVSVNLAHSDSIFCVDWAPSWTGKANETENELWKDMYKNGLIATGSVDETVKLWGQQSAAVEEEKHAQAKSIATFDDHSLGAISVAFRKDGSKLAVNSMDCHIRIYDVEAQELEQTIDCGSLNSWKLSYHHEGKHLATGTHKGQIQIWDTETGQLGTTLDTHGSFTTTVAYSPDGKRIATGSSAGLVYVLDVESGKVLHKLEGHSMAIRSVKFSPDGKQLFSASDDGKLNAYDVGGEAHTSSLLYNLYGHMGWVLSVDVGADGSELCSSSTDKTVKLWDARSRECIHTFTSHTEPVWGVSYNEQGTKIASVGDDAQLCIHQT